ncbi:MAG: non-canonical purine NTP pyrophosphatase, RdgB/HAM1 family [Crocinitomicaceae bacterium]|nr:non-canonical purine NTP pyrophosphatase, RdgB/HAM1 family [Crocinitomicaceae bacterium]|tara:strand:- start:1808 stop:2401 length:594 start_codon:yes stop_codon:yes gene_type:complete
MKIKKIVFATGNLNKLKEIKSAINIFEIVGLKDLGITEELPETGTTLKENALQKAKYVYNKTGLNCFSDDTGLEIESLNNRPGVYSAMYSGADCNAENNMRKVLSELKTFQNRKAKFKTVIALILNDKEYFFEGTVNGKILQKKKGNDGFGYDPIFKPEGYKETFAQMSIELKNKISHRGLAVYKLVSFLNQEELGL